MGETHGHAAISATSTLHFPPAAQAAPTLHFPPAGPAASTLYFPSMFSRENRYLPVSSEAGKRSEEKGAKTSTKWSDEQASALVQEWKERVSEVESSRSLEAWQKILAAVNEAGPPKSTKQCKDKIQNLKQAYKDAKTNNSKTGRGAKTSPFFELFDEVLGSRPVVTMPGVIQSSRSGSPSSSKGSAQESGGSDLDDDADSPPNEGTSKRKSKSKPGPARKKTRKSKDGLDDAFVDLTTKILDMQNAQVQAIERSQTRAEEMMLKLEIEQRKIDEESRRRDQEFFLRMAELLKK